MFSYMTSHYTTRTSYLLSLASLLILDNALVSQ